MKKITYKKFPSTKTEGIISKGWDNIIEIIRDNVSGDAIIAVDTYVGVNSEEIKNALMSLNPVLFCSMNELFKSEKEIEALTTPILTNDCLFGHRSYLSIQDYFDRDKTEKARNEILGTKGLKIIFGTGAAILCEKANVTIYIDMARWEILQRFRRNEVNGLGVKNQHEPYCFQYKRGYFNDWIICDKHKRNIFSKIDFWIDTHIPCQPKMISNDVFVKGIENTIKTPFRVVPFFDPAPWGGQWMKNVCGLDEKVSNFGWCFDCVPEENSLLFNVGNEIFELPSNNLVFLKSKELLGEAVEGRFGKEFPIRFDFLDTYDGGNLSLQVHPTTQYIRDTFGMSYTQDESYYLMDAEDNGIVYLGVKENVDREAMINDLQKAEKGGIAFDTEKYINKFPAKKHDHFLIPGGTIHCSGKNSMVLEISATPNIFTFKLWDWGRLGLDGKPRPINIDHGKNVINWSCDTNYTKEHLINKVEIIEDGDGWREEKTGLHQAEFIETRRHWFEKKVLHRTNGSVNVLNLIEGEEITIESPSNSFDPFVVHYAETFIIPASIIEYTIRPSGNSEGKKCGTIKAYVRF